MSLKLRHIKQKRPDGIRLKAEVYPSDPYPCINIIDPEGKTDRVCFAEFNPEKEPGRELCVGVYCASNDWIVYYASYNKPGSEEDE